MGAMGGSNGRFIARACYPLLARASSARPSASALASRTPHESPTGDRLDPEQQGKTVWQGRFGDVPLRVDILPSGRIFATWSMRGNERRVVVDTIQQLEQRVLFQLMLGAGPGDDSVASQVASAV